MFCLGTITGDDYFFYAKVAHRKDEQRSGNKIFWTSNIRIALDEGSAISSGLLTQGKVFIV
jgi:hypothetical protein